MTYPAKNFNFFYNWSWRGMANPVLRTLIPPKEKPMPTASGINYSSFSLNANFGRLYLTFIPLSKVNYFCLGTL